MTKINDPFGFTKTINSKVLNNPKVVKELSKMFNLDNEISEEEKAHYAHWKANHAIGTTYKKAVNTLKKSIKR